MASSIASHRRWGGEAGITPTADPLAASDPAPSTSVDTPASDGRQTQLFILAVCSVIVGLSMILTPSDAAVSLLGWQVPPLCLFKIVSGYDCLGCGLTRSFVYMGHLDLMGAFERHKLGPLLYLLVASQVPWRVFTVGRLAVRSRWGQSPDLA